MIGLDAITVLPCFRFLCLRGRSLHCERDGKAASFSPLTRPSLVLTQLPGVMPLGGEQTLCLLHYVAWTGRSSAFD